MDATRRTQLEQALRDMQARLEDEDASAADSRKAVTLDQQSVGRLSRMDAMQQQAMARAQSAHRTAQRKRIRAALQRIAEGEYGYCDSCGEEIAPARLEQDPATPRCIDCARG